MTLGQDLTHAEVLRLAHRAGAMFRQVHGRPDLIVSIARGGVAIGTEFGRGAEATHGSTITCSRPSNLGSRGVAREWIRRWIPLALRSFYRRLFFRRLVHAGRRFGANRQPVVSQSELTALRTLLQTRRALLIVVVDDAVDSGGTAEAVLQAVREAGSHHKPMLFALTSTAGVKVQDDQWTLFEDVIEYADGDVSNLLHNYHGAARWSRQTGFFREEEPADRRLYLDLDGTLVPNSFRTAYGTLLRITMERRQLLPLLRLLGTRLARRLRLRSHRALERRLDGEIRRLVDSVAGAFQSRLAAALRQEHRRSLVWLAQAPGIRAAIVTAALDAYRPAIEQAFELPVLTAAGPLASGAWQAISAATKAEAIDRDLALAAATVPALLLGDTLTDAMVASERVQVAILPPWDRTGMLTVLGTAGWWDASHTQATAQDRPA